MLCSSDAASCSQPHCFFLLRAVSVEFVKDRYTVETADTTTAIVCMRKTGRVDFDVTVEVIPKEILSEGLSLMEGEEMAKGSYCYAGYLLVVQFLYLMHCICTVQAVIWSCGATEVFRTVHHVML